MAIDASTAKRLRLASILISIGLVLASLTFTWTHALSFMTFVFIGGTLVAAGVLLYLWAVVSAPAGS